MALCYQPYQPRNNLMLKPIPRNNFIIRKYLPKTFGTQDVWFYGDKIQVTTTKSAEVVDKWIFDTLSIFGSHKLIAGLDIEWLPNLNPGEDHPVATIQICIDCRCLVFQVLHKDAMPVYLTSFLKNNNNCFVGVGVDEDARKLFLNHGLVVSNTQNLNQLASWVFGNNPEFGRIGLKRLATEILGRDMEKPKAITLSKWDAEVLSFDQIEYAAIDAFVSSWIIHIVIHQSFGQSSATLFE